MSRLPLQSKAIRPKFENKRAIFGDDDEDEESRANDELVLGFEDNKIKEAVPKKKAAPLSIKPQPNLDWRAIAKSKKEIYVPAQAQQPAMETSPEVLSQSSTSFGLQIQKKTVVNDQDTVMTEETTIVQQQDEKKEETPKTLEERAVEAIIRESLGEGDDEDKGPKKVIPADPTLTFKDDVENRPDETGMDAYEKIPVDEFGAALLRGLGWNEGEGIGRNRKNAQAPPPAPVKQREALLGLGAKPEEVEKDRKPKNRRAAYEYKDDSLFKKISKRKYDEESNRKEERDRDDRNSRHSSSRDERSSSRHSNSRDERSSSRHSNSRDERSSSSSSRHSSRDDDRSSRHSSRHSSSSSRHSDGRRSESSRKKYDNDSDEDRESNRKRRERSGSTERHKKRSKGHSRYRSRSRSPVSRSK